jgi:Fe-S-cluster containining protein
MAGRRELPVLKTRKPNYNCAECPGYCCTYTWIKVTKRDIKRLAKRFDLDYEVAERRYTVFEPEFGHRIMRHRKDNTYKTICRFFDQEKRCCGIYEDRPDLCRTWPSDNHCGFYDFMKWEREHQGDDTFVPFAHMFDS